MVERIAPETYLPDCRPTMSIQTIFRRVFDLATAKGTPLSAWVFAVVYMFAMNAAAQRTGDSAFTLVWVVTTIPLFWLWTVAVWRLQKRRQKSMSGPGV